MIRFHCPNCDAKMEVDESFGGRAARCPTCTHELKIPTAEDAAAAKKGSPRPGAPVIDVDGEKVEIRPPLEATAVISAGLVGLSVLVCLIGVFGPLAANQLAFGGFIAAVFAAIGTIMSLPAYQTIKRSRGGKRGRQLAMAGLMAGAALFVIYIAIGITGMVTFRIRPSCEQNLKQIHAALMEYAKAHEGAFPKDLKELVTEKYLDSDRWLTCPSFREVRIGNQTYSYVTEINNRHPLFIAQPEMMVASDGPPYYVHEDINGNPTVQVLQLNGDVVAKSQKEWAAYQKGQQDQWQHIMELIRNPRRPGPRPTGTAAPAPGTPTSTAPGVPTSAEVGAPTSTAPAAPPAPGDAPPAPPASGPAAPPPMPPADAAKGAAK